MKHSGIPASFWRKVNGVSPKPGFVEANMTINENCPCKKKKCERHGNCVECRKHHAASKRHRPAACERTRKYLLPVFMLILFETVAVVLWLTLDNLFYLFNFSYIGISVSLGIFLFIRKYPYARRVAQLLVGLYMLLYLALPRLPECSWHFWCLFPPTKPPRPTITCCGCIRCTSFRQSLCG